MNHELKFIDTHCHLDFPEFNQDREEVIQRAKAQGIDYIINIGSSLEGSEKSLELSRQYDFIYATVGLHPHEADRFDKKIESDLARLAKNNKVVAIGEIGLDYYAEKSASRSDASLNNYVRDRNYSRIENQKSLFIALLNLAKDLDKPVVIHNRQAEVDTLKILKEKKPKKAVVHCFSGDEKFLEECLDLAFFVSFTCNITYRKAENLRRLVGLAPLERILLETDAPFLPPEGFRGKRNEPMYVKFLAEEMARIKGIAVEEVAKVTSDNAKIFFGLNNPTLPPEECKDSTGISL